MKNIKKIIALSIEKYGRRVSVSTIQWYVEENRLNGKMSKMEIENIVDAIDIMEP